MKAHRVRPACVGLLVLAVAVFESVAATAPTASVEAWPQHGRDAGATRFSPLAQIDVENVGDLRLVWAKDLGFTGRLQGSPSAWHDRLFVSTNDGVVALDAASGAESWSYVENRDGRTSTGLPRQTPRGAPVVASPGGSGGDRVLVIASLPSSPTVVALDARDGTLRWRADVGDAAFAEALRTNPIVAGDVVVVGPTGADLSPVPGRLVALHISDGSVAWTFDVVPVREDDPARSSWSPVPPGRAYGVGGGTAWNAGAYDEVTRTLVFGTGQPVPADRIDPRRDDGDEAASSDLYTASFVALDASTGRLRWFHQVVPGDEWSYDQHTVPILTDLVIDGRTERVALLATTTGFVVVVEVSTGSVLAAHGFVDDPTVHVGYDATGTAIIDPAARRTTEEQIVRVCPGPRWANVAPGAFSYETGLLYRPNDLACVRQGAGTIPDDWQPGARPTWLLSQSRTADDFFERWGALTAIDPATGAVIWSFDSPYPHDAGVLVTSGGLVFSAFADRQFRAFDARSGEVLWSQLLHAHSDAAPITYAVDGIQYVAILAGRDGGVPSLPDSGLPNSVPGPATLFVFRLAN